MTERPAGLDRSKGSGRALLPTVGTTIPTLCFSNTRFALRKKWISLLIAAFALTIVAVTGLRLIALHKPTIIRIAHLQKLTNDGRPKGNLRTDGTTLYFNELEINREILVATPIDGGPIHRIETPFANVDLQDISNDGHELLVTSFDGMEKGGRQLWVMPSKGGAPRRVSDVLCDAARWSPDNHKIACTNGTSIMMFDSDGSAVHTVGSFSAFPRRLVWSPEGEKLRFVLVDDTARTQTPSELVISRNESAMTVAASRLSLGKKCCWDWIWTRNGENFLYTKSEDSGHPSLFIKSGHGSWAHDAKLPVEMTDIGDLAPGKSDNQLYLIFGGAVRGQLFKFDLNSKVFETFLPGLSADCLSFSRDGQWMTYVTLPDQSLWRSRADGSEAIQLTKPPMETEYSAWSPDGRQIAFMGKPPGKAWRIFLIDRDGGAMKEAAQGSDSHGAPTWSADGMSLAYGNVSCEETHSCWIRRLDVGTGKEELLPGSNGLQTARWSPDGKYILALQPRTRELMLFDVGTRHWKSLADSITDDNPNWSSDSRYIYADTLEKKTPIIERVRVSDGHRDRIVDLAPLQKSPGQLDYWIGLTSDNSPILLHQYTAVEVYALEWTAQ